MTVRTFGSKRKGKILIFVIVAVLVAVAGGGFAYMKFGKAKSGSAKVKVEEPKMLVPLDEFILNLADSQEARYLKVQITLEMQVEKEEKTLEEEKPRLRDAIISVLSQKYYRQLLSAKGKEQLKENIRVACNRTLGREAVTEVLFTDFAMQ